jgi:hypothetical protein
MAGRDLVMRKTIRRTAMAVAAGAALGGLVDVDYATVATVAYSN